MIAHLILSARPGLLSRSPSSLRPLLKALYGSVVTSRAFVRQEQGHGNADSTSIMYEPQPMLFRTSANGAAFSQLLQASNDKLFSSAASAVEDRVREIAARADGRLGEYAIGAERWKVVLFLRAPRLLTDPVWRLLLRVSLLKQFFSRNCGHSDGVLARPEPESESDAEAEAEAGIDELTQQLHRMDFSDSYPDSLSDDDHDLDVDMAVFQMKRDKLAGRIAASHRRGAEWTEGRAIRDILVTHGDVLTSPSSTFFRLLFLHSSKAFPIQSTSQVRDILKMNTDGFTQLLNERAIRNTIVEEYATFIKAILQSMSDLEATRTANKNSEQRKPLEAIDFQISCEDVSLLERQLCGALNDFYGDGQTDDSALLQICDGLLVRS